jgi:hypothetical protein
MDSTLTAAEVDAIRDQLRGRHIPAGRGTRKSACSVAAINLALRGRLTDEIPECMSKVIGRWIITIQDAMPDELRNSDAWRDLLPIAAGTGRAREVERLAVVMDWMWGTVLPTLQPIAHAGGYGHEWLRMTTERTEDAASAAGAAVARGRAAAWARSSASAAGAAEAAAWAAEAAAAADAAAAARAADAAAWAAEALAARAAADVAAWAAEAAEAAWGTLDPAALLARLIAI